jgi:hypothetical protein
MTSVMNPPGLGLEVPSSRQDVISALLNDYADSFGQNDADYGPMPIPALKELPPPPPSSSEKPLPSALSMRFQLRGNSTLLLFSSKISRSSARAFRVNIGANGYGEPRVFVASCLPPSY